MPDGEASRLRQYTPDEIPLTAHRRSGREVVHGLIQGRVYRELCEVSRLPTSINEKYPSAYQAGLGGSGALFIGNAGEMVVSAILNLPMNTQYLPRGADNDFFVLAGSTSIDVKTAMTETGASLIRADTLFLLHELESEDPTVERLAPPCDWYVCGYVVSHLPTRQEIEVGMVGAMRGRDVPRVPHPSRIDRATSNYHIVWADTMPVNDWIMTMRREGRAQR